MRRNTHQAQLRQKLKYDRAIRAIAFNVGDPVWVFCRYVPQKGSLKLMKAWREQHKVVHVLQDGRVYILDSGQKMHFERLKPHHSGPREFVALPAGSGEVVVVMDPEPERSAKILDDCSQPSYREEEPLSEASSVSLLSGRRHWMDPRLRTQMRAKAVVSTISNLTIPPPTQSVSALKTCSPMYQILPRLNLLS